MKLWLVLVASLVSLALQNGGALATPTPSGEESAEESRTCPMFVMEDTEEQTRYLRLVEETIQCMTRYEGIRQLQNFTTLEDFRQFFKTYCQEIPKFTECFQGIKEKAEVCVNQTNQFILQTLRGMLNTVLTTGCADEGEFFSLVVHGSDCGAGPGNLVSQCIDEIDAKKSHSNESPQKQLLLLYKSLDLIRDCLIRKIGTDKEEVNDLVRTLFHEIGRNWECIHPQDNGLVPCDSLMDTEVE